MSSDPGPPSKPPRSALTVRDMLGALGVLVLIVLAAGGLMRSCTFAPAGPTVDTSGLPTVDAPAELARLAPGSQFPIRVPALPPEWRANSVDAAPGPDGTRFVRTGFLTPEDRFLRLLQSNATEEALLHAETGDGAAVGQGVVDVDGQQWVAYTGGNGEPIWVTEVDGGDAPVRLLITGSGDEPDLRLLAKAVVTGEVLPPGQPR